MSSAEAMRIYSGSESFMRVLGKLRKVESGSEMTQLAHVVEEGDDATLVPEMSLRVYRSLPNLTRDGEVMLHQAAECMLNPGLLGLLVARDSPIFDLVNLFVLRGVEAGLPTQWLRAQRQRMVAAGVLVSGEAKRRPRALRVEQLAGPLLCLGAGLSVAALAWTAEMLWRRGCCAQHRPRPRPCHGLEN